MGPVSGPDRFMKSSPIFRLLTRITSAALAPLLLAACELTEVTTEPGADIVVVEAIIRAGSPRQSILLHRSLQGNEARPEPGARVTVTRGDGEEHTFSEGPLAICAEGSETSQAEGEVRVRATCYTTVLPSTFSITPGETYELRVVTTDGREMQGRTTLPGDFAFNHAPLDVPGVDCTLEPLTNLPITWSVSRGAWSYLAAMQIIRLREALAGSGIDAPDRLELTGLAISQNDTTLVIPSEVGVFELGSVDQEILKVLQIGFPAGVTVDLTVAAIDRNYANAVRGGSFNPSGPTRISSIVGDGVGVFGSIVPRSIQIQVGSGGPRCFEG